MTKQEPFRVQTIDSPLFDLYNESKKVDLGKIGHYSGVKHYFEKEEHLKFLVAGIMKKLDLKIEEAICVRPLIPKFDFILHDGTHPKDNTWNVMIKKNNYHDNSPIDQYVYRTDEKQTRMESKCILLTGMYYNSAQNEMDEVSIWRTGTKLIDRFVVEHNHYEGTLSVFATPIILGTTKNNNNVGIAVNLIEKDTEYESFEKLKIMGYVAEPIGTVCIPG